MLISRHLNHEITGDNAIITIVRALKFDFLTRKLAASAYILHRLIAHFTILVSQYKCSYQRIISLREILNER